MAQAHLPEEQRCEAALDDKLGDVRRREDARRDLVGELVEGRLTLLEAPPASATWTGNPPTFAWEAFRRGNPAASEDERHCQRGDRPVPLLATLGPGEGEEMARRLEAELADHVARGTLRLSESGE